MTKWEWSIKLLKDCGGGWLGAAREYLQWHAVDGDRLIWGSQTEVRGLTVRDIEDMAVKIASAALAEHEKFIRNLQQCNDE